MLFSTTLTILISNAVTLRRDKSIIYSRIAITVLIISLLLSLSNFHLIFYDKGLGIFSGLLQTTATSHVFNIFILIITAVILLLNSFYARKVWTEEYSSLFKLTIFNLKYYNTFILNKMSEQYKILEYPLIILFVVIGGILLMSSNDLITIFLAIELQSYGLYILCVVYRDSEGATSGGLTYFLLGGLSSCFILLASAIIYGNSGNTTFDGIYVINNISKANIDIFTSISLDQMVNDIKSLVNLSNLNYLNFSLIIMSVGLLFKVSAAPFHFWSPDVYNAIPTVVTTFVSTFAKISVLILLLELIINTNDNVAFILYSEMLHKLENFEFSWTFTLLLSSLFSLIIGAVLGLTQSKIKRLFAYSTISHVGFILLAMSINTMESIESFIFYLMQYSITNVNAFMLLIAIGYSLYMYVNNSSKKFNIYTSEYINSDIKYSPIQYISQLKGYFYINPFIALSLAITLFSFVGIPPLAGFFAKQMVLTSALDKGYVFMVIVAILTSAISAYYYLTIVKDIYFNKSDYILNPNLTQTIFKAHVFNKNNSKEILINTDSVQLSGSISITISIFTLIILLFMLSPQEWLNLATILATTLYNF